MDATKQLTKLISEECGANSNFKGVLIEVKRNLMNDHESSHNPSPE